MSTVRAFASSTETSSTLDFRLVPGAVGSWATTVVCLHFGWPTAVVVAALGALLVVASVVSSPRGRWVNGAVLLAVLVTTTAFGLAVRLRHLDGHELRAVGQRTDSVQVRVELTERPTPTAAAPEKGRPAGERAVVRARLRAFRADEHWYSTRGDVLLLVPGSSWQGLLRGQRLETTAAVLPPHGRDPLVAVLAVHQPPENVTPPPLAQRVAENLRAGLRRASSTSLGPEAAGLLPGLVVGDTGGLPATVREDFQDAGLTHLTAVSGANLAIVCGAALVLLRSVRAPPVVAASGAAGALLGFVVLAGGEPSVLRAAVMGGIGLLALLLGRRGQALPSLATSVIVLLMALPRLAVSPGFVLSVAATAALVLLAPGWSGWLRARGVPRGFAEVLAVPAAAQVATGPAVVALSGEFSLVGVLANMATEPMVAPATVLGVLATVTTPWFPWSGEVLTLAAAPALEWILLVARQAGDLPAATVPLPGGLTGAAVFTVAVLVLGLVARFGRFRPWTVVVLVLSLVAVLLGPVPLRRPWPPRDSWGVVACDVGQGDGVVLATSRSGTAVVVDTGPSAALIDECLDRLGVHRVPLLVLTHPHDDHYAGLAGVFAGREVERVGLARERSWADTGVLGRVRSTGARVVRLGEGQRWSWPGLGVRVLAPEGDTGVTPGRRVNDSSVVLRASTRVGRVLLTGDIELRAQRRLLDDEDALRAEVLKVPHHGSRYTSEKFLRTVDPRLALVSVGSDNDYGHPSSTVLDTLRATGALVRRTDRSGTVAVLGTAEEMTVVSSGNPVRRR
ncbi:ComEC/Rec2 family competence protein [Actinopolyspora mortivallis]|uniref:ComEC family competence protein n=1 Tax=Actinopolyspora mortivallis TaxID=33906 RepID=A0A2T0GYG1_ACTMO|nr:ComEC/Rec2 family competence protein [Actinopolyspora mortivallis]PRW64152.1 ComEC family competence protein [Actinopolyspora mortivallis]